MVLSLVACGSDKKDSDDMKIAAEAVKEPEVVKLKDDTIDKYYG